jgi:putative spermidine/putrescine transport system permease protein
MKMATLSRPYVKVGGLESAGGSASPSPIARMRGWLAAWLPAIPLLLLVSTCLIAPVVVLVWQSFTGMGETGLSLDLWFKVLGQQANQDAIMTSLFLAAACATVTLAIGAPLAWMISRMLRGSRAFWLGLLNVAANFGGIGLAFAYMATIGSVGMLTLMVQGLGLPFEAPREGSLPALVMAYEYTNVPLFVLLTIPAMSILRDDWWEAAQVAAATRLVFWRRIGVPILAPFLMAGWLLIFTWTLGIYGIAYGLAGQSGATAVHLITLQIGSALQSDALFGPGRAAILAVVLMLFATTSLILYRTMLRRALRWL